MHVKLCAYSLTISTIYYYNNRNKYRSQNITTSYLIRVEELFNLFSSGYRNLHLDMVVFSRKDEIFMIRKVALSIRFNLSLI